jgi:enoyl-CoA hydratase
MTSAGSRRAPTSKVHTERHGAVLVVTLDRPEVRNAIDTETAWAVSDAMDELDSDSTIALGVITGAGGMFCAGMDLKAFLAGERPSVGARGFAGLVEQPPGKPMIAAVEGAAVAGGFEIVLACDLVVAAQDARFGLPEVRRGLVAAGGGLLHLGRRIPLAIAMQWSLTGELVPAFEAARFGLVNRVVPRTRARVPRLSARSGHHGGPGTDLTVTDLRRPNERCPWQEPMIRPCAIRVCHTHPAIIRASADSLRDRIYSGCYDHDEHRHSREG